MNNTLILSHYVTTLSTKEVFVFNTYAEAKNKFTAITSRDSACDILLAREVRYGNLNPMLIGLDTTSNPFKEEYQLLKDNIREYLLCSLERSKK